jgi:excisionase family DNA binding protein
MDRSSRRALLSRREAAEMLAVSVDTIARLIDRGELQPVRIGRSVRVAEREVEALIERRLEQATHAVPVGVVQDTTAERGGSHA